MAKPKAKKFQIADVLHHYGAAYIPPGQSMWLTMKCPFHDDSKASARVHNGHGMFRCLACGAGGDAYSIVMEQEGIGFAQAQQFLAGIAGSDDDQLPSAAPAAALPLFGP